MSLDGSTADSEESISLEHNDEHSPDVRLYKKMFF
jgi:hypothetical protein